MDLLSYVIVGIVTGILSGLLGLGGGVVMVPALTFLFSWQGFPNEYLMQLAAGTSLAAMIMTTLMATWSHHRRGTVQWTMLKYFLPGMVGGSLLGVWIAKQVSTQSLRWIFACFAVLLSLKLLFAAKDQESAKVRALNLATLFMFAIGIGILAGLLGLGGGVLLIPLFLWLGLTMTQASATSAACAFPTSIAGATTAMIVGWHIPGLPPMTWGFVVLPVALILGFASLFGAPLGVILAHRLPVIVIKRIFGGLLLLIAWRMVSS